MATLAEISGEDELVSALSTRARAEFQLRSLVDALAGANQLLGEQGQLTRLSQASFESLWESEEAGEDSEDEYDRLEPYERRKRRDDD